MAAATATTWTCNACKTQRIQSVDAPLCWVEAKVSGINAYEVTMYPVIHFCFDCITSFLDVNTAVEDGRVVEGDSFVSNLRFSDDIARAVDGSAFPPCEHPSVQAAVNPWETPLPAASKIVGWDEVSPAHAVEEEPYW